MGEPEEIIDAMKAHHASLEADTRPSIWWAFVAGSAITGLILMGIEIYGAIFQ